MQNHLKERPWTLIRRWLPREETDFFSELINKDLKLEQPVVKVFGSKFLVPRKTLFLSDEKIKYSYSGLTHDGKDWPKWFSPLLEKVSHEVDASFNGCLINLYRNGLDIMGWLSDNESELDMKSPIAS